MKVEVHLKEPIQLVGYRRLVLKGQMSDADSNPDIVTVWDKDSTKKVSVPIKNVLAIVWEVDE